MRITLVRHGQSLANIQNWDYNQAGDHKVELTDLGRQQAHDAGQKLEDILRAADTGKTLIYCSPYLRTRQTLDGMLDGAQVLERPRVFEDARLRETEHGYHGNYEEQQALRRIHGWFYYRYQGGESPADCFDRTSTFLESMMRQAARKNSDDVVIVTHGLTIRCFVMRFLHLSVEEFESLDNPHNCDIITIDHKMHIQQPVFKSGRWAVEGIRLRAPEI